MREKAIQEEEEKGESGDREGHRHSGNTYHSVSVVPVWSALLSLLITVLAVGIVKVIWDY